MLPLIAIIIFVAVALAVFAVGSLLDQRRAQSRLIRERLANDDKAVEPRTGEELALLRDEMLSRIPAFDSLLRRSVKVSNLQTMLEQGGLGIRAGNILILCMISAIVVGGLALILTSSLAGRQSALFVFMGIVFGGILPYSYASYMRGRRFRKFEELFPEAIDTLTRAVRA